LAAFDLGAYGLSYVHRFPTIAPSQWVTETPMPYLDPTLRINSGPSLFTMRNIRLASGYSAMVPNRILPLGQRARKRPESALVKRSMRIASVQEPKGMTKGQGHGRSAEGTVSAPLPRARLVTKAVVAHNVLADLLTIDIDTTALTNEPVELAGDEAGQARIIRDAPGEIQIEVVASSRQLLVLNESFHPGWTASQNGEECRILRIYGDFMGCQVGPGKQSIRFQFRPRSFRLGYLLSGLGLAGLCAWAIFLLWRSSGRARTKSTSAI
jgi:hypothetical protein